MPDLILHHYDFSPFSEKIRLILGYKTRSWRSVIVPSMLPKPLLLPLTGGYRRTPVLQIGADIFCDTSLIAHEIDRQRPDPPLLPPRLAGEAQMIARWAEELLFWPIARYASGLNAEHMPEGLHADRAAMRGMPEPSLERLRSSAARNREQMLPQIAWIADLLDDGREWLQRAAQPTLADFAVFHCLWFLGALRIDLSGDLGHWPRIGDWMRRVAAIGHGQRTALSGEEALEIAAAATPRTAPPSAPGDGDPHPGSSVSVRPEEAFGPDPVVGTVAFIDAHQVAIRRHDPRAGEIVVHFPRLRYVVKQLD